MKIYTKTGDDGETGLFGGPRVRKDSARIEAYGTIDELNAMLGLLRAQQPPSEMDAVLSRVQHELFELGAELATPDPAAKGIGTIASAHIARLEQDIDRLEVGVPPLKQFILPVGTVATSLTHVCRTICRRAERRVVTLSEREPISTGPVIYLNRLSDLLFVLARALTHAAGGEETPWKPSS